jgi:hypothetical protein
MVVDGGLAKGNVVSCCRLLHLGNLSLPPETPRLPNFRYVVSRGRILSGREGCGRLVVGRFETVLSYTMLLARRCMIQSCEIVRQSVRCYDVGSYVA